MTRGKWVTAGLRIAASAVRGLYAPPGIRGAVIIPPARPGSEGDALLVGGLGLLLAPPVRVAVSDRADRWGTAALAREAEDVLRAATRLERAGAIWARVGALSRPYRQAWFIGADVVDGTYNLEHTRKLDWIDLLARRGTASGVCGFSFSETPDPDAVACLRSMHEAVVFVARGEVSAERFRRVVGRSCRVAPDLGWAVLTEEFAGTPRQPTSATPTIGVNLAPQVDEIVGDGRLTDAFLGALEGPRRARAEVELLAHDRRGRRSDAELLAGLARRLGMDAGAASFRPGPVIRRRLNRCDVLVTCRMHLTISALAFGVPVVALDYNDKYADLIADPDLAPHLRVIDPGTDDFDRQLREGVGEMLAHGRIAHDDLDVIHRTKRAALSKLRAVLAGAAPRDSI